ncbi:MAG: hypothetical protein HQ530_01245 [Parcubacteria group bacterium]|nr:hypothetical protein [Parcubacteria group bacterium]
MFWTTLQKINMSIVSSDAKFTALHEHYNNTFTNIKESIKLRDKLTALILVILLFVVLFVFWPTDATIALTQISTEKLGLAISFDEGFLGSIIWFALLIAIVRYTQTVVYIERQYAYIHRLEEKLHIHFRDEITFTREGKSYLQKYPKFSDWIWTLYMIIFPSLLVVVILINIIGEWANFFPEISASLVLNTLIVICILISIAFYLLFMYYQK